MKRIFSFLLIILTFLSSFAQNEQTKVAGERPKVAVVLSGGGAKGFAHVSALKVIEKAGIPIDMIVGTSMGALVGGLYASGYTTAQLDSIIACENWMDIILDKQGRTVHNLEMKQKTEPYMLNVAFDKSPFEILEGGFLKGNSVSYLISALTADRLEPMDYSDLPIPFACIATDIVTSKEIVMKKGILAESLRSSMAIPGIFPPVKLNGMVLVDGGLKNNFPVDVAREMGADYVIGVSVASEGLGYDNLKSSIDVLMQVMDVVCTNKIEQNRDNTDIYTHVDVKGYSAASFTRDAIDSLLVHGDRAACANWDKFIALRDTLDKYGPLPKIERKPKSIKIDHKTFTPPSTIYNVRNKSSFVGVGARFDNEELASILLGGEYELNPNSHLKIGINGRLGKRIDGNAYATLSPGQKWKMEFRYRYTYSDLKLYNEGDYVANPISSKHRIRLDFSRSWKNFRMNFGSQFAYVHYNALLSDSIGSWQSLSDMVDNERTIQYYISFQFDNTNTRLLARKGMKWLVKYNYITDNGYGFNDASGVHIVEGYWRMAIPLSRTTVLNPSIEGRFITDNNTYFSNMNFIGGIGTFGHYMTQQLSFAGINYVQIAPNSLIIGGLNLRQQITDNNYLFFQANYGLASSAFGDILTERNLIGGAMGYGYRTPAGPIEFNFNYSNVTKRLGVFLNIGYMF